MFYVDCRPKGDNVDVDFDSFHGDIVDLIIMEKFSEWRRFQKTDGEVFRKLISDYCLWKSWRKFSKMTKLGKVMVRLVEAKNSTLTFKIYISSNCLDLISCKERLILSIKHMTSTKVRKDPSHFPWNFHSSD